MLRNRQLPSVTRTQTHFSQVPSANIQRSSFDRSHGHKTTFDAGWIVPVFLDEVLPGDTHKLSATFFGRLSTPIVPVMDNLYLDVHFFFVPTRLLWENWERFNGAQDNPSDSTDFLIPVLDDQSVFSSGSLADYFGLPITTTNVDDVDVSALPFRAYNLVCNDWYRDENFINSAAVPLDDGPDDIAFYPLQRRGKRKDYFTSCLPWPQKGPAVDLPLGVSAPVELDMSQVGTPQLVKRASDYTAATVNGAGTLGANAQFQLTGGATNVQAVIDPNGTWIADLSDATAATINSLRQAFQVQRLLERDARGGTRYTEILTSHFKVQSPDSRLQRPEYLGGLGTRIDVSPIPQTSSTDDVTPLGTLGAYGVASVDGKVFSYSAVEHGYILGLASVRSDYTYFQGIDRLWSRQTRFDFYWPTLAHLGEQAVLSKELYYVPGDPNNELVFGYQERYAEYRYKPSRITGKFRPGVSDSLDIWHFAQNFPFRPLLNQGFIQEAPPLSRVKAVEDFPDIILDIYYNLHSVRPMPVYSVPGLIDHF